SDDGRRPAPRSRPARHGPGCRRRRGRPRSSRELAPGLEEELLRCPPFLPRRALAFALKLDESTCGDPGVGCRWHPSTHLELRDRRVLVVAEDRLEVLRRHDEPPAAGAELVSGKLGCIPGSLHP